MKKRNIPSCKVLVQQINVENLIFLFETKVGKSQYELEFTVTAVNRM